MVANIWQGQIEAQRRYTGTEPGLSPEVDGAHLCDLLRALVEEAHEALTLMPSRKRWGRTSHADSLELAKQDDALGFELADCFLFIIACTIWAGYSADDLLNFAATKQQINLKRADHGNYKG